MPNITVYLPEALAQEYQKDAKKRGLLARLLARHYGFKINEKKYEKV